MIIPKKVNGQETDVMIVDAAGSEYLKHCIPATASVTILPLRGVVPWVMKSKFFLSVCSSLLQKQTLGKSIVFAIVDVVKPKVLITFVDNAPLMGTLQEMFPEKLVISVQNGLRSEISLLGGWDIKCKVPVLYGFGDYEKHLLKQKAVKVLKYIPAGSLKFGLFLHKNPKPEESYDICFISQFNELSDCRRPTDKKALDMLQEYQEQMFTNLLQICKDNGYRLSVALRYEQNRKNYYNERNYFKNLDFDNIATLIDNRKGDFGSYKAVSSAKVNIASFTTLAMEIFGNGGKVLWYLPSDLLVEWGFGMNFEKMPKEVLLDSLGVQSTKKKYTALLNMDQNKYLEITESARSYYMKCQKPYPHQVIKKRIADFIDKKSM